MSSLHEDIRQVADGWRWGRRSLPPASSVEWHPEPPGREFPTAWARTPAATRVREAIQTYALKPLVWTETDPKVEGLDHLDGLVGPVMFVSNHSSHLDAPLVLCSLPKKWRQRTATAAAADYFFDVWWRAMGTALAFNAIPIERAGQRKETSGLGGGARVLRGVLRPILVRGLLDRLERLIDRLAVAVGDFFKVLVGHVPAHYLVGIHATARQAHCATPLRVWR